MEKNTLERMTLFTGIAAVMSGVLFTATLVSAQTYYYVDTQGNLEAQEANSPAEAMMMAEDIAYNSGVIEADEYEGMDADVDMSSDSDTTVSTDDDAYLYVDEEGDIDVEVADTPTEAINDADDIKYNSGVIDAESYAELSAQSTTVTTSNDSSMTMDEGTYLYVTADGRLASEDADTAYEALNDAENIKYDSGVITREAYMKLAQ